MKFVKIVKFTDGSLKIKATTNAGETKNYKANAESIAIAKTLKENDPIGVTWNNGEITSIKKYEPYKGNSNKKFGGNSNFNETPLRTLATTGNIVTSMVDKGILKTSEDVHNEMRNLYKTNIELVFRKNSNKPQEVKESNEVVEEVMPNEVEEVVED